MQVCVSLKLNSCYDCRMLYVSILVIRKEHPMVGTQKIQRKESNRATIETHQITKTEGKRGIKEQKPVK